MTAQELDDFGKRIRKQGFLSADELDSNLKEAARQMPTFADAMRGFSRVAELLNKKPG